VKVTKKLMQDADLVMTRILWLDGLEPGNANTHERFIYIHGTNHEEKLGEPASHGCIRMGSADLVELFELVDVDTLVAIKA
jgi:lipoprotein-anchoring transpeptidase ErfK/SrfK